MPFTSPAHLRLLFDRISSLELLRGPTRPHQGSIYIQYFWPELLFAFPFSTSSVVWDLLALVGLRVVGIGFLLWFLVRPPLLGVRCLAFSFVVSDMVGRMRLGEDETASIDTVKGRGPRPAHSNPGCCAQSTW